MSQIINNLYRKSQVFIRERVGKTSGKRRLGRSGMYESINITDCLISRLPVLIIDRRFPDLVQSRPFIREDTVRLISLYKNRLVGTDILRDIRFHVNIDNFIPIISKIETGTPFKIILCNIDGTQHDLDSRVPHLTDIG